MPAVAAEFSGYAEKFCCCFDSFILKESQEVRSNPRASARERFEKKLSLGGQRQVSQKKSGIRTQESGVAGVAEYASKVFIRKSGTGICPGKSPPESQIL